MPDLIPQATPAEPILTIEDLHVHFADTGGVIRAVEGLSLSVGRGRALAIVGESGCGKSVTARAILRILDRPGYLAKGRILLRARGETRDLALLEADSHEMRGIRGRDIALVFQEPMTSFSPAHTVGNQIVEAIRLHVKLSRAEAVERALEQLASVGAPHPSHLMSQYAWELSGGLRQRAMIAMALVCGPELLIADEPTTALDVTTQAQVLELLGRLQRERAMGLILITHDLGVVAETADEVVVMYLGAAVERAPVGDLFEAPLHPYTQALMRSMPNVRARPRTRLATLRGSPPHPLARPSGCPFHTRCSAVIAGVCDTSAPPTVEVTPGHVVSCHLYDGAPAGRAEALVA